MAAGDLIMSMVVDGRPFFPCGPCSGPPPAPCCLYPNPQILSNGAPPILYPGTDSPDTVLVTAQGSLSILSSEPFSRTFESDFSGFLWIGPTYPVIIDGDFLFNATWRLYPAVGEGNSGWFLSSGWDNAWFSNGNCLIDKYTNFGFPIATVEDDFPSAVNADIGYDIVGLSGTFSRILTRISLCVWEWRSGFQYIRVAYGQFDYKYSCEGYFEIQPDDPELPPVGVLFAAWMHDPPQNAPMGNYSYLDSPDVTTIVIS